MTFYWPRPVTDPSREAANSPGEGGPAPSGESAIAIGRSLGTVVVTLRGVLDTLAATRLAPTLNDLIDGQGNLAVAVDLSRVPLIAPSGVRVLSAAASRLDCRGGRLLLCEARDGIQDTLECAGLGRFIEAPVDDKAERGTACGAGGRALSSLHRRAAASHPAGSGRQVNIKGGNNDRV